MALVRAYETWSEDGGASLRQWGFRHLKWSTGYGVRSLYGERGYRWGSEAGPSMTSVDAPVGDDTRVGDFLRADVDVERDVEDRCEVEHVMRIVERVLSANRSDIDVPAMVDRLAATDREMAEVARRQGVSREAVRRSRQRMIEAVRREMGIND